MFEGAQIACVIPIAALITIHLARKDIKMHTNYSHIHIIYMQTHSFIINPVAIKNAMRSKGYDTIDQLAQALGVHRNTISPYLSGQRALPDCLDRLLDLLDLTPADAIIPNTSVKQQPGLEISLLISAMVEQSPSCCYVLFGSRAKRTHKKYSDYDIGVYSEKGLALKDFSSLINLSAEWQADKSYDVNLTNLSIADHEFLSSIKSSWVFLGGNLSAWITLQNKAGVSLYE